MKNCYEQSWFNSGSTVQRIEEKLNSHLVTPSQSAEELTRTHEQLTSHLAKLQESVSELGSRQPQQIVSVDTDALSDKVTKMLQEMNQPQGDTEASTELMRTLIGSVEDLNNNRAELKEVMQDFRNQPPKEEAQTVTLIAALQDSVKNLSLDRENMKEAMLEMKKTLTSISETSESGRAVPKLSPTGRAQQATERPKLHDIRTSHNEKPVDNVVHDFISEEIEKFLTKFIEKQPGFVKEGGREVLQYGYPYKYPGSKSPQDPPTIPTELTALLELVNEKLCKDLPPANSILINKYVGETASISQHSDNEPTIDANSVITTISIGSACIIDFTPKADGDNFKLDCQRRSAYTMTRRSQDLYLHQMQQGNVSGTRYSLTFRALDVRNKNSCCIIGDSNTGSLRFGDEKGTFGRSIPGKQVYAPVIEKINPYDALGYKNVVIQCGINDIRMPDINSNSLIRNCYSKLARKIDQIHLVNKHANIFVCPILPTKCLEYNRKAIFFNSMIFNEFISSRCHVKAVDGFDSFLDDNGMLRRDLSRHTNRHGNPDYLHLNGRGSAFLASLIKTCIILRVNGGVDPRLQRMSNRVNGRTYADVSRVDSQSKT